MVSLQNVEPLQTRKPVVVKHLIGRRVVGRFGEDEEPPYNVINGGNGDAWVEAQGEKYSPSQISAFTLQNKEAANYLGEEVTQAVITVPAYFNDAASSKR